MCQLPLPDFLASFCLPMKLKENILIIGASARHLAQSAKTAGLSPLAIDLFGDWDLGQIAKCQRVESLSKLDIEQLPPQFESVKQFMICGGMETRGEVVAKLASKFSFLGPQPIQLSRTQDPFLLNDVCLANSIAFPAVRKFDDTVELTQMDCEWPKWLSKPLLGSGGHSISLWNENTVPENHFLQERINGISYSALFVSNHSGAKLLGITRQLVGQPLASKPFAYCGSVGPIQLHSTTEQNIARAGDCVAEAFKLTGCFGIDFIVDEDALPWLIEINPRITASAEVLELAGCIKSIVGLQIHSCSGSSVDLSATARAVVGKAIVYSDLDRTLQINDSLFEFLKSNSLQRDNFLNSAATQISVADIPRIGTKIQPGHPIVSIFVTGETVDATIVRLIEAVQQTRETIKKLADLVPASS